MDIIQDQKYYREAGRMVFNDSVKKNVEIMSKSSECRKTLMKEGQTMNPWDMLSITVKCIYDLVGDEPFSLKMNRIIEERRRTDGSDDNI